MKAMRAELKIIDMTAVMSMMCDHVPISLFSFVVNVSRSGSVTDQNQMNERNGEITETWRNKEGTEIRKRWTTEKGRKKEIVYHRQAQSRDARRAQRQTHRTRRGRGG